MKKIINSLSLWHTLLGIALTTMVYLIAIHTSEALSYATMATYFKGQGASLAWSPSEGAVDSLCARNYRYPLFLGDCSKKRPDQTALRNLKGALLSAYL